MENALIIVMAKYLYLMGVFIAVAFFFKTDNPTKKKVLLLALISFPLSLIIARISALFIKDTRPFVIEHVKPLIAHVADNGFPSDHTLLTMAIASVVFAYNKKVGIVLFVVAFLVGTSRILALVHHPLDIIGSTVIATGVTALVYFLIPLFLKKSQKHHRI